ncbi:MAG: hypothetical protein Q8O41_03895, partial [Candidatus Methanoperedens sp.]|nr:hypothetical protein [Candidatus Methanoperedens sp.]
MKLKENNFISRVKERSFNLPLLVKPYEPISSIRLSSGISHNRRRIYHSDNSVGLSFQQFLDNLHEFCQMAFSPVYQAAAFLVFYYPIVVIVLLTSSLSRPEPLCWVKFFPPLSRPLHPSMQVLCVIGLSFIAAAGSSDFSYRIALTFPSGYISA